MTVYPYTVADPGFPVGGGGPGPPTRVLFGKNVCQNERIGSRRGGGRAPGTPPRSANVIYILGKLANVSGTRRLLIGRLRLCM